MEIQQQLQLYADQGCSQKQIAKLFNKSKRWVNKQLKIFGIHTHAKVGPPRTKERAARCLICKNEVKKGATKYCSSACFNRAQWENTKACIEKEGKVSGSRKGRRYLIEKYDYKCVLCNNTHWQGQPMPLVLDHIDGNSDNWDLKNLRMICCNCDALTPTYKNRNRGNGRFLRRIRYREGKSY
jgi:hypothetical protein